MGNGNEKKPTRATLAERFPTSLEVANAMRAGVSTATIARLAVALGEIHPEIEASMTEKMSEETKALLAHLVLIDQHQGLLHAMENSIGECAHVVIYELGRALYDEGLPMESVFSSMMISVLRVLFEMTEDPTSPEKLSVIRSAVLASVEAAVEKHREVDR